VLIDCGDIIVDPEKEQGYFEKLCDNSARFLSTWIMASGLSVHGTGRELCKGGQESILHPDALCIQLG
jgi:hypothetical protein